MQIYMYVYEFNYNENKLNRTVFSFDQYINII